MSEQTTGPTKDWLIAEIAANREKLQAHRLGMRRAANPGDRLKRSFREHKEVYIGAAVVAGLLLSAIPARRKYSPHSPRGFEREARGQKRVPEKTRGKPLMAALGAAVVKYVLDLGKPMVVNWLRERALGGDVRPKQAEVGVPPGVH